MRKYKVTNLFPEAENVTKLDARKRILLKDEEGSISLKDECKKSPVKAVIVAAYQVDVHDDNPMEGNNADYTYYAYETPEGLVYRSGSEIAKEAFLEIEMEFSADGEGIVEGGVGIPVQFLYRTSNGGNEYLTAAVG